MGSRLHICHLSTKGSVELVRWAKERGIDVTAEVTPHHLLLTDELVRTFDPVYKVNPPLRTEEDVQAVRQAVADGTIDVIGTDHAPHPRQDKECEWSGAAHGMTGLETALSIAQHTLVDTGLLTWADVARVLSETPARIGGLGEQGRPLNSYAPSSDRVHSRVGICIGTGLPTRSIRTCVYTCPFLTTCWLNGTFIIGRSSKALIIFLINRYLNEFF